MLTEIYRRIDWLSLPHDVNAAPNEAVARHPRREEWHERGKKYKQRWHKHFGGAEEGQDDEQQTDESHPENRYGSPNNATCRVQVVRSVGDWSHGVLTEHSIQNACKI